MNPAGSWKKALSVAAGTSTGTGTGASTLAGDLGVAMSYVLLSGPTGHRTRRDSAGHVEHVRCATSRRTCECEGRPGAKQRGSAALRQLHVACLQLISVLNNSELPTERGH
jgi:hypothetical protein